jgi:hypothetical protein
MLLYICLYILVCDILKLQVTQAERTSRARRKLSGQSINQARDNNMLIILTRFLLGRRGFTKKYKSKNLD